MTNIDQAARAKNSIDRAAHLLNHSPSVRAQVRRLEGNRQSADAVFWQLATRLDLFDVRRPEIPPEEEAAWRAILAGLAYLGEFHDAKTTFGSALRRAGYSETRLDRLLTATGSTLEVEIVGAARFLASKRQRADWSGAAALVLGEFRGRADDVRRKIARSFFETRVPEHPGADA